MRVGRTTEALPLGDPSTVSPVASEPSTEVATAPTSHSEGVFAPAHSFLQLLRRFGQELDRGEEMAARAIRGGPDSASLSPERLIALQAGIYRYSEAVDLVTKLVDRGTQAVRTTLQNQ
ncbi:MAG TPA: hypothetical protein VK550_29860 [Polyangiaceae bacterium]|nr:hypothetical protein [Polyangiaceae bacterium]